jgi:hypothetical protein
MDIAGSISLSLYIRDKEKEQHPSHPLAPVWAVLNYQHLKVLDSMISSLKINFIWIFQDKHIDKIIGVKSAALKFSDKTKIWLWATSLVFVISLVITGYIFHQTWPYFLSLLVSYAMISHKVKTILLASCFCVKSVYSVK